ncbi:uncharacterized protein YpmB [Natronobacillus azotifigens]|uniref:DUF5590 domain-containing protein n=1 Tax=Natronobacillus azotifigens TaxID=472978 RepID=A0A9J6R998_9BACI|nr:DUF5590 domain-containing protein [Natronobacillus azotifigens]MCZ0701883.1 DUF5590 domain-containing protein [Natronobacillus azotifigens]
MKQRSLLSIVPNWLKIGLVVGFLLLIGFLGYGINLYQTIQANKTEDFDQTRRRVIAETELVEIDDISRYHGNAFYHVVTGTTSEDEQVLAYVLVDNDEEEILIYHLSELTSKETVTHTWQEEMDVKELLSKQYGIRGTTPLLEFIYIDANNRLSYDYYRLDDGSYDSGISFSQKFN